MTAEDLTGAEEDCGCGPTAQEKRALWPTMTRRVALGAGALGVVGLAALAGPLQPRAFAIDGYPSWDDVQAAKNNEAAKGAEIQRIQTLIAQLQADVASKQAIADQKSQEYFTAQQAYFDAAAPIAQPTVAGATPVKAATVAPGAACQRRILMNSVAPELIALDADTGAFCADFGTNGRVDLRAGMGKGADKGEYYPTSAPTLAGTTIVIGGRVADNVSTDMPGGVVRGFDVVTGALRWAFDPGNPEVQEAPPQGKTYTRSTPNVWAPMSYDPQSNTV